MMNIQKVDYFFSFGEEVKSVESKLYEKDLVLNYNKELLNI